MGCVSASNSGESQITGKMDLEEWTKRHSNYKTPIVYVRHYQLFGRATRNEYHYRQACEGSSERMRLNIAANQGRNACRLCFCHRPFLFYDKSCTVKHEDGGFHGYDYK